MDELSVEQVAAIRGWIRQAVADGHPLSQIDSMLKAKYPKINGSSEVMKMSGQDFARSMGQGLTLGHLDEAAGLVAKLRGKDYTTARDAMRNQDAEAKAANPKMSATVEMLSGAIPGVLSSAIPGMNMEGGAYLANAAKSAAAGAGIGAVAGEGASNAPTAGGVAMDAGKTALLGGGIGALGGVAATKLGNTGLPTGPKGKVMQEGAGLLPNMDANQIQEIVARQERLAPATTVAADLSPQMQTLARGVGADLKIAMAARAEAEARFRTLNASLKQLGSNYDTMLAGLKGPTDPELIAAVAGTGKKGVIPRGASEVDLTKIQDLRSELLRKARMTNDKSVAFDLRQSAQPLTDWLQKQVPEIRGLDSDYAFLSQRASVARKTMQIVNNSAANYGTSRAYGSTPGSVGASIPLPGGGVGTVIKTIGKALTSGDRASRARSVYEQFLTPTRDSNTLQQILKVHDLLQQPINTSLMNAGTGALRGAAVLGVTQ
jgi:hypothetical protein